MEQNKYIENSTGKVWRLIDDWTGETTGNKYVKIVEDGKKYTNERTGTDGRVLYLYEFEEDYTFDYVEDHTKEKPAPTALPKWK